MRKRTILIVRDPITDKLEGMKGMNIAGWTDEALATSQEKLKVLRTR
jgi:hypothetical protein